MGMYYVDKLKYLELDQAEQYAELDSDKDGSITVDEVISEVDTHEEAALAAKLIEEDKKQDWLWKGARSSTFWNVLKHSDSNKARLINPYFHTSPHVLLGKSDKEDPVKEIFVKGYKFIILSSDPDNPPQTEEVEDIAECLAVVDKDDLLMLSVEDDRDGIQVEQPLTIQLVDKKELVEEYSVHGLDVNADGDYNPKTNTIRLKRGPGIDLMLHELNHAIDDTISTVTDVAHDTFYSSDRTTHEIHSSQNAEACDIPAQIVYQELFEKIRLSQPLTPLEISYYEASQQTLLDNGAISAYSCRNIYETIAESQHYTSEEALDGFFSICESRFERVSLSEERKVKTLNEVILYLRSGNLDVVAKAWDMIQKYVFITPVFCEEYQLSCIKDLVSEETYPLEMRLGALEEIRGFFTADYLFLTSSRAENFHTYISHVVISGLNSDEPGLFELTAELVEGFFDSCDDWVLEANKTERDSCSFSTVMEKIGYLTVYYDVIKKRFCQHIVKVLDPSSPLSLDLWHKRFFVNTLINSGICPEDFLLEAFDICAELALIYVELEGQEAFYNFGSLVSSIVREGVLSDDDYVSEYAIEVISEIRSKIEAMPSFCETFDKVVHYAVDDKMETNTIGKTDRLISIISNSEAPFQLIYWALVYLLIAKDICYDFEICKKIDDFLLGPFKELEHIPSYLLCDQNILMMLLDDLDCEE